MIRVLHIINGEHYSGAERVQDLLALGLAEVGYDVSFACIKPGLFPDARRSRSTPLYKIPMKTRLDIKACLPIIRLIRKQKISIIHSHTTRGLMVAKGLSLYTGIPLVHHMHSRTPGNLESHVGNCINTTIEKYCLRKNTYIIAVSDHLAALASQWGASPEKIHLVPNGVPEATLSKAAGGGGCQVIGCIGLFRPRKGLEVLIDSLAELKKRGTTGTRLRLVGPFESEGYHFHIKAYAQKKDVYSLIEWAGFKENIQKELACMDVCVLPSIKSEGMPMVILEAMAAGIAVVGSGVMGVSGVITHNENGLLVPAGNSVALADAIGAILSDEKIKKRLGTSARNTHQKKFSATQMCQGVADVYRSVLQAEPK